MIVKNFSDGDFYNADCFDVMKNLSDNSVDMILADLPYAVTHCEWDVLLPFDKLWDEYWRLIKPKGAIVLTASQPFTTTLINSQIKHLKCIWYWQKERGPNFMQAKRYPMRIIEECVVFSRETPNYYPIMEGKPYKEKARTNDVNFMNFTHSSDRKGVITQYNGTYPKNLLKFNRDYDNLHPTQKPVKLFEYLIKTYTKENEVVLDNTAGSGTTAIACMNTNRKFICIEKEEKYYNTAVNRIEKNQPLNEYF